MRNVFLGIGVVVIGSACAVLSYNLFHQEEKTFFLEKELIDAGEVKYGTATVEVVFVNHGAFPIKVTGATTSCNCVVFDGKNTIVPAKGTVSAFLSVTNKQDEPNNFAQSVQFFYTEKLQEEKESTRSLICTVQGRFIEPLIDDRILSPPHTSLY